MAQSPGRHSSLIFALHFCAVAVLLAVGLVLHYPQQTIGFSSPSLFTAFGMTRHAIERIYFIIPISYAAFFIGTRTGIATLIAASAIMFPRVFLLSEYRSDALLETLEIIAIGGGINWWFARYRSAKAKSEGLYQTQLEIVDKLRISEQRFRELFESAQDAIWVHDLEGNVTSANKATGQLVGYDRAEIIGKMNVRTFLSEQSLHLAGQVRHRLLAGEEVEQPYEQRLIKKDGSQTILMLTTNLLREHGEPNGFLCIARDVSKERETSEQLTAAYEELQQSHQMLQESQDRLIRAERLTSLGELAASVAHEVNNPIAGILIYDQLLMKRLNSGTFQNREALEYLARMEGELKRVGRLIQSLLEFSRQSTPCLGPVDVNAVLEKSLNLVAHTAELQTVKIVRQMSAGLPTIVADSDQLNQVFVNLMMNAIQAMPGGGIMTVHTATENRSGVEVEVQDTGVGISKENMRSLFTPFFTTKKEVKGVGLGLAVSHGIIEQHKGRIEVESEEGKGSVFRVILPGSA